MLLAVIVASTLIVHAVGPLRHQGVSFPAQHCVFAAVRRASGQQTLQGVVLRVAPHRALEIDWLDLLDGLHGGVVPQHSHGRLSIHGRAEGALCFGRKWVSVAFDLL